MVKYSKTKTLWWIFLLLPTPQYVCMLCVHTYMQTSGKHKLFLHWKTKSSGSLWLLETNWQYLCLYILASLGRQALTNREREELLCLTNLTYLFSSSQSKVTKCHHSCCATSATPTSTDSIATSPPPPPLLLLLPARAHRPSLTLDQVSLQLSTSIQSEEQQAAT